jgi:hypothetical protein
MLITIKLLSPIELVVAQFEGVADLQYTVASLLVNEQAPCTEFEGCSAAGCRLQLGRVLLGCGCLALQHKSAAFESASMSSSFFP